MSNTNRSLFSASDVVFDAAQSLYSQEGLKEKDRITKLPGQPNVAFSQYGGYVTVDQKAGRALYYYFAEAQHSANSLPLLLWLNGGPGCSSLAYGAMQELGPFRVKSDGKTLFLNEYSWNHAANLLFLESPAGVGFSYSNTTDDVVSGGDKRTAIDNYAFLLNWLERFPEYKNREFYISGESYAGHYVPQLAHVILRHNRMPNNTIINLKGIIIGNAVINDETDNIGQWEYLASHALITEDLANQALKDCDYRVFNPTQPINMSDKCNKTFNEYLRESGDINIYNIYAPVCLNTNLTDTTPKNTSIFDPDPCSYGYVYVYLNRADVQKALHANVTKISDYDWELCSYVLQTWTDSPYTVLDLLKEFLDIYGLRVWIFSGDVDGRVPVTSTQLSIKEMKRSIQSYWRPWYLNKSVGGYTQEYEGGLTFATVRGAGHEVPTYQPSRAHTLIQSFLAGKKLPVNYSDIDLRNNERYAPPFIEMGEVSLNLRLPSLTMIP
ncbi:serine carboxypeptidase-like 40 [Phtheirospermum japonicum]|uniref:Carboxypeptidase n=1 Tax=Phtheirospermum japonicum TaxID=374723 RepID=A0A830BDR2_9LAMI|nr:serine carboxypeptidase-like 40 [Phtheirospermum japonicum]